MAWIFFITKPEHDPYPNTTLSGTVQSRVRVMKLLLNQIGYPTRTIRNPKNQTRAHPKPEGITHDKYHIDFHILNSICLTFLHCLRELMHSSILVITPSRVIFHFILFFAPHFLLQHTLFKKIVNKNPL